MKSGFYNSTKTIATIIGMIISAIGLAIITGGCLMVSSESIFTEFSPNILFTVVLIAALLISLLSTWIIYLKLRSRDQVKISILLSAKLINLAEIHQRAEEMLETNDQLLRQFIVHTPAAIAMLDNDMRYLQISQQWIKDYRLSGQDIIGKSHYEIFPDAPDRWKEIHQRVLNGSIEQCDEDPFPRADGSIEWLQWEARPWHKSGGEIGGLIFFTQVITERRNMETELKTACDAALEGARVKSEFLANMSHEIRTPMNGIIGMTELMMDTELEPIQERYIKSIKSCSESLLTILNDILDISKVEAGMLDFEYLDFDLRYSVENVIELLAARAHKKNLEIAMTFQPDVPTQLCGDPTRLRQILTNLVSNAVKFTEKGEVVVNVAKVSEDNERVVIRFDIKDTGIGIPEAAKKLLFSPFAQADSSITRLYGGSGLGLAISKQLVEMMDGGIEIESETGRGTTVTFTASFIKQANQEVIVASLNLNLKDLRVLVVDDNETNRLILTEQMTEWGIIVEEAEDGAAGIEKLRFAASTGNPFKITVLDQIMPEINGIEIAKLIKADPLIAETHLVLMTSYSKRGHGELARKAGIRAYFKKPVRQSELLECLSVIMSEQSPENKDKNKLITQHSLGAMKASLNRHILLVEDNEINQEVALSHLSGLGYRIDVATNGEEAIKAVTGKKYDAVLMDCQMPVMDGFQATAEIRKLQGKSKYTPIIAMTAYAMPSDRDKCLMSGMDNYLAKPVKKDKLKEILQNLFETGSPVIPLSADEDFQTKPANEISPVDLIFLMDAASYNQDKLEKLVELYSRHTAERLDELNDAIKCQSAKDVFAIAHKCLGSSRALGMTAIVPALRELERIGDTGELRGAEEQYNLAKYGFEKITMFLEQHFLKRAA